MKQLLLSLALLAGAPAALAQQAHAIKLNVLSSAIRTGSFFYEHKLSERSSAQLGLAYTALKSGDSRLQGVTVTPEYRYYFSGEALDGFYVGPFARLRSFRMTVPDQRFDNNGMVYRVDRTASSLTFGGGAVIGRQWLVGNHITLDLFTGLSYNASTFSGKDGVTKDEFDDISGSLDNFGVRFSGMFSGTGLRSGFTVGFAF